MEWNESNVYVTYIVWNEADGGEKETFIKYGIWKPCVPSFIFLQ